MNRSKSAYELSQSQVSTPARVISTFWQLTHEYRPRIGNVLDLGAGDCRFAQGGNFRRYTGIEIDRQRAVNATLPDNGRLLHGCAFRHQGANYDACIGNPPYVRHHDIESPWKENIVAYLERQLGIKLNKHGNLYLYFMCLGLLKTHKKGLLGFVIPYEWVSRPSAESVREYIKENGWNVAVYRFKMPIFAGVLTTASISLIDKQGCDGEWTFFDIGPDFKIQQKHGAADGKRKILKYASRGKIWAMRGLSPGSQKIFTLTEGERNHFGLKRRDVTPCVTTLKHFPRDLQLLSQATFKKHFVDAGQRCWLIKSYKPRRSQSLNAYLKSVPKTERSTYTCLNQHPWFNFTPHPVPQLLASSGFTEFGPKVLINSVGAVAAGSVFGIHSEDAIPLRQLQRRLTNFNFEKRVIAHAKTLKKIEVRQFNAVLNLFSGKRQTHGTTT